MECAVHYTRLSKYSGLRSLTDNTIAAVMKAKAMGELVRGASHHEQQYHSLPEILDEDRLKVHPECYKKFTLINTNKHIWIPQKTPINDSTRSSACLFKEFRQTRSSISHQLIVLCQ